MWWNPPQGVHSARLSLQKIHTRMKKIILAVLALSAVLVSSCNKDGEGLFAALEYWNGGFVYNGKRNAVAMLKKYQQKFPNANKDGE